MLVIPRSNHVTCMIRRIVISERVESVFQGHIRGTFGRKRKALCRRRRLSVADLPRWACGANVGSPSVVLNRMAELQFIVTPDVAIAPHSVVGIPGVLFGSFERFEQFRKCAVCIPRSMVIVIILFQAGMA